MTVLYSNDFEAVSHLAKVAALPTVTGSSDGFIALNEVTFPAAQAPRGTISYGSADSGDRCYWSGDTALTDQAVRTASILISGSYLGHMLRAQTGSADRSYLIYPELSGGNLRISIDIRDGGSLGLTSSSYSVPATAGDVLHMESRAVGTTIESRIWVNGDARPSTATISVTASNYASGAAGLYRALGGGTYAVADDLVITDAAGGEDFFYASGGGSSSVPPIANFYRQRRAA